LPSGIPSALASRVAILKSLNGFLLFAIPIDTAPTKLPVVSVPVIIE
jgi:hypothetical protein